MIEKKGYYGHPVPKVVKIIFFRYLAKLVRMKTPVDLAHSTKASSYSHQNSNRVSVIRYLLTYTKTGEFSFEFTQRLTDFRSGVSSTRTKCYYANLFLHIVLGSRGIALTRFLIVN